MKSSKRILLTILYYIGMLFIKSWRIKTHNEDVISNLVSSGKSPVIVLWHDSLLPLAYSMSKKNIATIASDSKDGDIISFILEKWSYFVARGSSTRGGLKAAMSIIKHCKKKPNGAAITVDGPVGPRHEVKSGAVFIAKNLSNVLIVVTLKTKSYYRFNSWDKFILPKPFAKIDVYFSEPFYISDEKHEDSLKAETERLEKYMLSRTEEIFSEFI